MLGELNLSGEEVEKLIRAYLDSEGLHEEIIERYEDIGCQNLIVWTTQLVFRGNVFVDSSGTVCPWLGTGRRRNPKPQWPYHSRPLEGGMVTVQRAALSLCEGLDILLSAGPEKEKEVAPFASSLRTALLHVREVLATQPTEEDKKEPEK